jgi:hypothetical protein
MLLSPSMPLFCCRQRLYIKLRTAVFATIKHASESEGKDNNKSSVLHICLPPPPPRSKSFRPFQSSWSSLKSSLTNKRQTPLLMTTTTTTMTTTTTTTTTTTKTTTTTTFAIIAQGEIGPKNGFSFASNTYCNVSNKFGPEFFVYN